MIYKMLSGDDLGEIMMCLVKGEPSRGALVPEHSILLGHCGDSVWTR